MHFKWVAPKWGLFKVSQGASNVEYMEYHLHPLDLIYYHWFSMLIFTHSKLNGQDFFLTLTFGISFLTRTFVVRLWRCVYHQYSDFHKDVIWIISIFWQFYKEFIEWQIIKVDRVVLCVQLTFTACVVTLLRGIVLRGEGSPNYSLSALILTFWKVILNRLLIN